MKELILPWPDKRLLPNARVHWSKRSGAARLARHLGAVTALEAGCKGWELPDGRLHLHVTFHPPTKLLPDDDNMLAWFKSYRDGIADKRFISHPLVSTEVRKGGQSAALTGTQAGVRGLMRGGEAGRQKLEQAIDDFAVLGSTPSVGQGTGRWSMQGAESLLGGGPASGGVMRRFAEGQNE